MVERDGRDARDEIANRQSQMAKEEKATRGGALLPVRRRRPKPLASGGC